MNVWCTKNHELQYVCNYISIFDYFTIMMVFVEVSVLLIINRGLFILRLHKFHWHRPLCFIDCLLLMFTTDS